jgi:hypothetical protein
MIRILRELRLIPVVLLATACLAALKLLGLLLDGGYILADLDPNMVDRPIHVDRDLATGATTVADNKITLPQSQASWAQQMLGYPDITGSVPSDKPAEKSPEGPPAAPAKIEKQPEGRIVELNPKPAPSPSERAILERLQERRQELESRGL